MKPRILFATAFLMGAVSCSAAASVSTAGTPGTDPPSNNDPSSPIALVVTDQGLAAVTIGASQTLWNVIGAVAAPDGSAIFAAAITGDTAVTTDLVRIDPRSGATLEKWTLAGRLRVGAVSPGGALVTLAEQSSPQTTTIVSFDPTIGVERDRTNFEGTFDPEAFSTDGGRIYSARTIGDHYEIHTLELTSGKSYVTQSLIESRTGKQFPPEDMYGDVVQAVLSADNTMLATLYRDSRSADHTAFVHLLDLKRGVTVCIDLHEPFGTGANGSEALRQRADGVIEVGHVEPGQSGGTVASFDPRAILAGEPQVHYGAEVTISTDPPRLPDAIAQTPGFKRYIATVE